MGVLQKPTVQPEKNLPDFGLGMEKGESMGLLSAGKGKKFPGGDPEPCGALASSCQGILLFCSNERAKPGHLCMASAFSPFKEQISFKLSLEY